MQVSGAVIISGSPGLKDGQERKIRQARDFSRSRTLMDYGLQLFLDSWYAGELWNRYFCSFPSLSCYFLSFPCA